MVSQPSERVGTEIVLDNDRVRVWELVLEPGESLAKHIHQHDYLYLIVSGSLIRFADPDNPSDYRDVQFHDGQVAFLEVGGGKVDNQLTNIGDRQHRNYVIELKR